MEQTNSKRRNFMRAIGLGAAAATAALLAGKREAAQPKTEETAAPPGVAKGYHLSAHVQRYYHTTRI